MGIYRYQGQRGEKLRDRSPQGQTSQSQNSQSQNSHSQNSHSQATQDWHPQDWHPQAPQRRGLRHWLKYGRSVGVTVKNVSVIVTGGVVIVSVVALLGMMRSGSRFFDQLYAVFTAPQPEPQIDMEPILVQQLRSASELTTAVFAMQTVVPTSRDRTLGGYVIGRTTLLYLAYGEVRAGVDLSDLGPENVQVNGDSISVLLPPPQILDSKVDVNRSKVYDYDRGFMGLGPDAAPELQQLAEQATLDQIVAAACDQGVLQAANDRAKSTVSQLLETAGYDAPVIETQQPLPDTCPATRTTSTPSIPASPPATNNPPSTRSVPATRSMPEPMPLPGETSTP